MARTMLLSRAMNKANHKQEKLPTEETAEQQAGRRPKMWSTNNEFTVTD